jgi:predicted transcriptional regulator
MNNQLNWNKIKEALKENFIEHDFKNYENSTFLGVDFDNGLEIFRYILEKKLLNHDETKSAFAALQSYAEGEQNKPILVELVGKYEPFVKKLFDIIGLPYTPNPTNPKAPALGWCYNKLPLPQSPQKDSFYATTLTGKITKPTFLSTQFSNNFLTDNTKFGKSLHSSYHLRNSNIHNDAPISNRDIPEYITDCILSYLYFTFKYYTELCAVISISDLQPALTLTIKDLASLSGGAYNPNIENEVKRDNIIQTIERKLNNLDALFIEGEDGIGKTTLLHQFVAKYSNNSFSYFIDSKDSATYSNLSILRAFCNQIYFAVKNCELDDEVHTNDATDENWLKKYLSSHFHHLTGIKKSNQTFYFVIDGLDEISQDRRNEIKEQVLNLIPYKKQNIKLVLTGKLNKNLFGSDCNCDKFEMVLFSKEDSKDIFGNNLTQEQFGYINNICQNNAGMIVFFRDLIKKYGIPVENIINNLSSDLKALYHYIWNNHLNSNEIIELILAIITFRDEKYNAQDIAKLLNINEAAVIDSISSVPFVRKNARGTYEYIFEGYKNFAEGKLFKYKNRIDKVVIEYLINDVQSIDSLIHLSEIYQNTGKTDDLLKLLSNDNWNQLLNKSEKISVVSRVSNVALQTVQDKNENKYIPTILKYSILKSALKELSQTTVWKHEIATNLVLGEYIMAENLANIAFLKEDKLKMFASIAKAHVKKGSKVPENILRKVEELYEDIKDFKNVKEAAVEIASLLMYSSPKLAFRLIEDLSGNITDNDNAFDWALAQISLSVHSDKNLEDVSKEDINTKVYSKIRNPRIKEFADAILYLSDNQTSEQIIDKINQLESTSQKMFLIRNWINNNTKDGNVSNVIELGLELVVNKSDKYVPKSSDYKVFAMPLPYLSNKEKTYELIEKIEQYTASIESTSATNDLLAINLFIARTLCNFDFDKGEEKLFNIHKEIENLSDLAVKCTCLAIYANETKRIIEIHNDKNLDMYLDSARKSINGNIDNILEQTAMHFEIVQSIIKNLVNLYPDDVIKICKKLNKATDRDNALLESVSTYLGQNIGNIDISVVDNFLNNIFDLDIKKIAISEIIKRLSDKLSDKEDKNIVSKFFKYFDEVDTLLDNRVKCLLYIDIISILENYKDDYSSICEKLNKTWIELEKSVDKIELGFEVAYNAAFLENKNLAKTFLRSSKQEKENPELLLDSPNTSQVFNLAIELAIRLFAGLINKSSYDKNDIKRIEEIINSWPSERQQIKLWSSLILRIIPKSKKDDKLPNELINSYIIPKLSKIKNKNERINAILEVIVVLYFVDKRLPYLEELPSQKLKDIALSKVCTYLFSKCLPEDDCDDNNEGYTVDFEIVKDILGLTSQMSNDYFIAHEVIEIRKSIVSKNTQISNQQKIDIKKEFEKIANTKLPDNNNIRHLGYQIFVKANALSIQYKQKSDDWIKIVEEVDNIPNLSDRIFMWVSVMKLLPQELLKLKKELINKALDSVYKLPSFLDTVERLEMIFITLKAKNTPGIGLKQLGENFIENLNTNPASPFLRKNYRKILDVFYEVDPMMAKALVNSFDKDRARMNTGAYLNNHLNLLEFQSKLEKTIEDNRGEQLLLEGNPKYFNKIIGQKLSQLNASKIPNDKLLPKDLIYQLKMASNYSIYDSYDAFSYFIERLVLQYEKTEESEKLIRKSFTELLDVCDLIKLLSIRNAEKIKSLLDIISEEDEDSLSDLESIKNEISNEKYITIVDFLSKKIDPNQISIISEIDLEKITIIADNL